MARPIRFIQPECLYHVTSRGVDRRNIVRDHDDRQVFVQTLGRVVDEKQWILHSWVLMTNHVHLVVRSPQANLSDGMRDLFGSYAARFNEVHGRVGHLFQRRFYAKAVRNEGHLLELVRYLPLNPVRSGLVTSPADWRWSSYRAVAGLDPAPSWLECDWTLAQFHPTDRGQAQIWFREFVDRSRQEPVDRLVELIGAGELRRRSHGPARKLFAELAHKECGLTLQAIGERLGTTLAGASLLCARSRELSRVDPAYAERIDRLRENLRKGPDPFVKFSAR